MVEHEKSIDTPLFLWGANDNPGFLELINDVLPEIPPDVLANNAAAQEQLHKVLWEFNRIIGNSVRLPLIVIQTERKTSNGQVLLEPDVIRGRMILDDPNHIYYFGNDAFTSPESATYSELQRVPWAGGPTQGYNLKEKVWESNGHGKFLGVDVGNDRMGKRASADRSVGGSLKARKY